MTKQFLTESFGDDAIEKIAKLMDEDAAREISVPIFTFSWLPEKLFVDLLVAADKTFGKSDYALSERIGNYLAKEGIPKLYHVFIQVGSPAFALKNSPRFWSQLHDNGKLEVTNVAPNNATIRIVNKEYPHKAFCRCMIGYIRGVLELTDVKNILVAETKCVCDKNFFCEYTMSWK